MIDSTWSHQLDKMSEDESPQAKSVPKVQHERNNLPSNFIICIAAMLSLNLSNEGEFDLIIRDFISKKTIHYV